MTNRKACNILVISLFTLFSLIDHAGYCQGARYDSKGKRDPFVSLIGGERVVAASLADIISINDLTLDGVAIGGGGKKIAVINGEMVKENEKIGNLEIKRITKNRVILSILGKDYALNLIEGGEKSEK